MGAVSDVVERNRMVRPQAKCWGGVCYAKRGGVYPSDLSMFKTIDFPNHVLGIVPLWYYNVVLVNLCSL